MLYLLVFEVLPGTPKANLAVVWQFIKRHYKEFGTLRRYRAISKLSMFVRKTGYAKLRGKAAEVMGLGPALLACWKNFMDGSNNVHKMIRGALQKSVEMETILKSCLPSEGYHALPPDSATAFKKAAFLMASLTTQLRDHFHNNTSHKIFTLTSKTHMLLHVALLAGFIHPRLTWCFSGEDYMKRVQRLISSCCTGFPNPAGNQLRIAKHYRLGLHLGFDKIERQLLDALDLDA